MPTIAENFSLKSFNTFGIAVNARYFVTITSEAELIEVLKNEKFKGLPRLVLGGGSNILFTKDFPGLVVHIDIKGLSVVEEDDKSKTILVGAGENWHEFVLYAIAENLGGIENLAFIPGSVGAAPMQNIGAYGVEAKQAIAYVEGIDAETLETKRFSSAECCFGYRESIFKREYREKFIITKVAFSLNKPPHILNTSYGAIEVEINQTGKPKEEWTIQDVSAAVIHIRKTKLPDPKVLGTAGSFFKNPIVSASKLAELKAQYPEIPSFPEASGDVKIPAGWLIDTAGWKGKRIGDAGVHKDHALVLVNYANASGNQVWDLAMQIQADVTTKFGIKIEPEVNVY
jgi:UDP-N-acetylmuramate dehydrogenase